MKRKKLALLLSALLMLSLFTGCIDSAGTTTTTTTAASTTDAASGNYYNEPGTLPIVKDKITLTAGVAMSSVIEDRLTNEYTIYLEKNSNIHLDFEEYPADEYLTKIDLMMAAGGKDLPDILFGTSFSISTLTNWGQAGMIKPLNEYFNNLAHYLVIAYNNCAFIDYDTALSQVTSYDGNIYGIPSYSESPNDRVNNGRFIIYKEWLKALNMNTPTTLDEMRAYLEGVRDKDLNGNGNTGDEIPLVGYSKGIATLKSGFLTPFLGTSGHQPWINRNGKIEFTYNKEEYRKGLYYIKALIDDGLLEPLTFTQEQTQMTALITSDPYKVGAFMRISASNLDVSSRAKYAFATALAGPDGKRYQAYSPANAYSTYLITDNCAYPEAAFLLGDYMGSEENSIINNRGFEGKDWRAIDPTKEINLWGNKNPILLLNSNWGKMQNVWWANQGVSVLNNDWATNYSIVNDPNEPSYISEKEAATVTLESIGWALKDTVVAGLVYNVEETKAMTDVWVPIEGYVNECFTRFIMGDLSLDKDWDTYLKTLDKMGLQDCIDAVQSCATRMGS